MKRSLTTLASICLALLFVVAGTSADEKKTDDKPKGRKPVTTVKCPVAGKDIKIADAKVVEYRKAKVYVCCDGCKAKMTKDATPFATKANQQLVKTRQYRQVKCPISGGKIDKEQKTRISGSMVKFCCGKCKTKAEAAKGDEQLSMAFGDKAFEKAYVPVKNKAGAKKSGAKKDAPKAAAAAAAVSK